MNKLLFSLLAIAFSVNTLFASAVARKKPYKGECLYINKQEQEQDFKSCQLNIQQKNLKINFEDEELKKNNTTISGKSVQKIASGEYAQKLLSESGGIVSGVLLGPVNSVTQIFAPDRDYQQYIIEYKGPDGKDSATILHIERSDLPEFQQELTVISGKLITFQEGQTNTTINVGPDLPDVPGM